MGQSKADVFAALLEPAEAGRATDEFARAYERIVAEAADLVFHLLVGLAGCDVAFDAVVDELARRRR